MGSADDGGVVVLLCHCEVVLGTISSEGVAFQATFRTWPQNPGDKLCGRVCNVA